MILKRLEVGPIAANCYIVGAEKTNDGMIIDPGDDPDDILKTVSSLKLKTKLIVITHSHSDHIGGLKKVKEETGADLAVHKDDLGLLHAIFRRFSPALPNPERLLTGGDKIEIGELSFLVLHTPGHSRGGICLYGHGIVFTGDTLFNFGIGRTDFPGGSQRQLLDAIHTKLMVLPDTTMVYPGHGPESTIGAERRRNPFLREDFR